MCTKGGLRCQPLFTVLSWGRDWAGTHPQPAPPPPASFYYTLPAPPYPYQLLTPYQLGCFMTNTLIKFKTCLPPENELWMIQINWQKCQNSEITLRGASRHLNFEQFSLLHYNEKYPKHDKPLKLRRTTFKICDCGKSNLQC